MHDVSAQPGSRSVNVGWAVNDDDYVGPINFFVLVKKWEMRRQTDHATYIVEGI